MANAMNISQPIASDVENVEFTFLSPKEILAISVKRIENDSTFDNLLNPVPGGLYDPALGSYGDTPCATCNLNQSSCPGHTGHISLPAPVYHPIFLDQAYRLLRATCVYCKGFRLPEKDLHKYVSQLKLLQHGMLYQAHIAGAIGEHDSAVEAHWGVVSDSSEAEDEDDPASVNAVVRKREKYVRSCLRGSKMKKGDARQGKHEGASEMRREIIKQFLAEITRTRICASCGGISPSYRKDGFVKIFENSLSDKERLKMGQKNMKRTDAMTRVFQKQSKTKPEKYTTDEGVADVDSPQHSDMEVDEVEDADSDSKAVQVVTARKIVSQRYISPMEVQARLSELFHKEQEMVFLLYNARPRTRSSPDVSPEMFFMTTILVPPNRFRPEARMGDEQVNEAQQNSLYKNIMRCNGRIAQVYKNMKEARADVTQLHQAWIELQEAINSLIDKDKNPVQGAAAARNEDGIKQKLEKKEGLFRKNMMGKRVNFAARSVISPDPNIETNEIGVPPVFAEKLTYPEPVTGHNFKELQNAVMNGPHKYPGAWAIESEDGVLINLRGKSMDQRIAIANTLQAPTNPNASKMRGKKVYRHLTNGDVVLMNRQPTLHKPSIMGHRVRVLPGEKTIRMHYANCNTYNADFDGDEMNMHFPQNEVARAEALNIADTDHQYLSYTAGKPLRGLIQDHISVSIALCNRDTFLNKGDYQQLVYSALRPESGDIVGERIQLVAPAIIKPVPRWTGKQVFTTILTNIQPAACGGLWLKGESQIKAEQWGSKESEEGTVLIQDGEFISGILDKAQIGPSSGGIIHAVHEAYGPSIAGKLLSSFGRLLTRYLNMRAFSCGMDDLRLTSAGEEARREALQAANRKGLEVASKYVSLDRCSNPEDPLLLERLEEVLRDDSKQEGLDLLMNSGSKDITDAVQKACIPNGLEKPFPKNQMQAMTTSGAKGSRVNASLISCNLGQQVLEGRRVPVMVSGKSLPCFAPFDSNVRAGGFIVNRFLTGIRPQEYYFHHMAGREGLIDTAVKTSRSGYLQRCVIKGMEGLTIGYDTTVRDADNSIVQFLYGEDGLDPTKQKYLTDFSFTLENARSAAYHLNYDTTVGERLGNNRKVLTEDMKKTLKSAKAGHKTPRDPVISKYNPATHAFVTSESFYEAFTKYLKENKDGLIVTKDKDKEKDDSKQNKQLTGPEKFNRKNAEVMFSIKYLRSLVEPGEAVGIVAGQSVGEPSTQMTLNTFHLAGHSAKNVTLGIPRLREILMTASRKISTPSMSLHPLSSLTEHDVDMLSKSVSVLPFADVLDKVSIEEKIGKGSMYGLAKMYRIRFDFFPASEYTETYGISINDVMSTIEKKLLATIRKLAKDEITARNSQKIGALPEIGEKVGTVEMVDGEEARPSRGGDDDDDDDDDDGDDDATNAKQRANRSEAVSYGPNDDDDDAVQKAMDRDSEDDDMEDEGIGGSPPPSRASDADSDEDDDTDEDASNAAALRSKARADRVKQAVVNVTRFKTDEETGEWCEVTFEYDAIIPKILMLNIVQNAIKKTVIRQISGIGSATTEKRVIHTNGVNLRAMQELASSVDVNKIETNDIGAVLEVYGVEACRGAIVRELSGVFGGHGIKVDNRHLNLIADYMTRNGDYTPFNRMGLRGNVSPFTKMSFETTLAFLKDAVLDGDWDDLTTPSSRLVMGSLSRVGTGGFDVLTKLPMYQFNPLA